MVGHMADILLLDLPNGVLFKKIFNLIALNKHHD